MDDNKYSWAPWVIGGLATLAIGVHYLEPVFTTPEPRRLPARTRKQKRVKRTAEKKKTKYREQEDSPYISVDPKYKQYQKGNWRVRWYNERNQLVRTRIARKETLENAKEFAKSEAPKQAKWWVVRDVKNNHVAGVGGLKSFFLPE